MNRSIKSDPSRIHRRHSDDFKRSLMLLSFEPGASVARIARDNGIKEVVTRGIASSLCVITEVHK